MADITNPVPLPHEFKRRAFRGSREEGSSAYPEAAPDAGRGLPVETLASGIPREINQSEQELRVMIDTIPALAWTCLPDGAAEFLNRRWLHYTGRSLRESLGWGWTESIHPADLAGLMNAWLKPFDAGGPGEVEGRLRRFDGEYRWFLFRAAPLRDEQGKVVRWYGTSTDIEDRKHAQEGLRAAISERTRLSAVRADIGMALARRGSLREILRACAEAMVQHLDAAFARVWTLNNHGAELELQASAGMYTRLDGSYSRIRLGELKIGQIAQNREAHLTNDVQNDSRISDCDWARAEKMTSFAGYPLVVEDRIVGVMGMFSRSPLMPSTLETLAFVADGIAQGVERKQAEEKLQRSEADLLEAQRLTHTGSWKHVLSSGRVEVPPEIHRIFGTTPDEDTVDAAFWFSRIHPEDRKRTQELFAKCEIEKTDYQADYRLLFPDGTIRHQHSVGHPILSKSGELIEFVGTAMDTTEQVRARAALEKAFAEIKVLKDQLYKENLALRDEVDRASMFEEIVGNSRELESVLSRVAKVAPTDSTVLITGETGTGKELIARAIHKRSPRSPRAFVGVNCAALAPSLITSELFGHEKGAFTGATQRRLGRFELADGGTIFLDEVGELPADTQVALLRVLQEREFERVGGKQSIHVDVRVIAATNRKLDAATAQGTFRSDLFYRLNVFPIEVPPLRERQDDILMLLEYFVDRFAKKVGKKFGGIDKRTLKLFRSYDWPGNIRELQNVVERSVIVSSGDKFCIDESWLSTDTGPALPRQPLPAFFEEESSRERQIIEAALAESRGRVSGPHGAAAKLGIPPSTLDFRIKKLNIRKTHFRLGRAPAANS